MAKKIFMPKNNRGGGGSPVKLLLWPAIALIVLVLLVTLIMQPKDGQDPSRKPPSERGAITREIPRLPIPEESTPVPQGPAKEGSEIALQEPKPFTPGLQEPPSGPGSIKEREAPTFQSLQPVPGTMRAEGDPALRGEMGKPEPAPQLSEKQTPEGLAGTQPKPGSDGKGVPKLGDESKKPPVATAPQGAGKLSKLAPNDIRPAPDVAGTIEDPKKKPVSSGKSLFTVQVGTFKEKQNADEIRGNLQKKGYDVILRTRQDSKLGQIFVVQLKAVANKGTASTLMEQIKNEQKVQPIIIEMQGGGEGQQ